MVELFSRHQGVIYSSARFPNLFGLESIAERGLSFADRQPLSGTHALVREALDKQRVEESRLNIQRVFSTHLELALSVLKGHCDVGVGTLDAALACGLDFIPLTSERFMLAIPLALSSHERMAAFVEHVLDAVKCLSSQGVPGYDFSGSGRLETVAKA